MERLAGRESAEHQAATWLPIPAWLEGGCLLGLTLLLLCWGNEATSYWDRDEPRYAGTAREMLARQDLIVPYFNGTFRFQKPPLLYWLIAAGFSLFGDSEFMARFWSALALALAALLTWRLGNDWFGRPAGLWAGFALVFCPVGFLLGKLVIPDGPQLVLAIACYSCLIKSYPGLSATSCRTPSTATLSLEFWLGWWLGLSILLKGPIVLGMVLSTILLYRLFQGPEHGWPKLHWGWLAMVTLVVTVPWLATIWYCVGPAFFAESVGNQIGRRVVLAFNGRWNPPGYYALLTFLGFAPWLPLTLLAIRKRQHWLTNLKRSPIPITRPTATTQASHADALDQQPSIETTCPEVYWQRFWFLLAWALGPMILLELFRSKQIHYYGPAYPALSLLAGGYLACELRLHLLSDRPRFLASCLWATIFSMLTLAGLAAVLAVIGPTHGRALAALAAILATLGALGFGIGQYLRQPLFSWSTLAGVQLMLLGLLSGVYLPRIEPDRLLRPAAQQLAAEQRRTGEPIVFHQIVEPSLTVYGPFEVQPYWHPHEFRQALQPYTYRSVLTLLTEANRQRLQAEMQMELPLVGGSIPHCRIEIIQSWTGWVKMHPDVVHLVRIHPKPIPANLDDRFESALPPTEPLPRRQPEPRPKRQPPRLAQQPVETAAPSIRR